MESLAKRQAIENGRRFAVKPKLHLTKAAQFAATAARLDPIEDYKAVMWAGMHMCTHWTNAIFHAKGLTDVEFDFEHFWYIDRCPDTDRVLAGLDGQLGGLLDALAVFEGLRTAYVRGPAQAPSARKSWHAARKFWTEFEPSQRKYSEIFREMIAADCAFHQKI